MKTFYVCHIELIRNIGNKQYTRICKTLEEAKAEQERVNAYNSDEDIHLRDSYCWKITRHAFKNDTEKFREMEYEYERQHGELDLNKCDFITYDGLTYDI